MLDRLKRWLLALVPAFFFLLFLELATLSYYFQGRGSETFGLQAAIHDLSAAWLGRRAVSKVAALDLPPAIEIYDALYSPGGSELLAEFERRYQEHFAALAAKTAEIGSLLVVLYIPPPFDHEVGERVDHHDREFFRRLADRHGASFLDASEALSGYPRQQTFLLPENFHLSRLGNHLLAAAVADLLDTKPFQIHRSPWKAPFAPKLLGDIQPDTDRIWANPQLPYQVKTNGQGLRMPRDLEVPKSRQRILLLGDSFTFGIHLPDVHTYPALLQARLNDREILNAGVPGYSIPQERALFVERAHFCEPDITILQVLFNDLYGLFYFEQNLFARGSKHSGWGGTGRMVEDPHVPGLLEKKLLNRLGVETP